MPILCGRGYHYVGQIDRRSCSNYLDGCFRAAADSRCIDGTHELRALGLLASVTDVARFLLCLESHSDLQQPWLPRERLISSILFCDRDLFYQDQHRCFQLR